MSIDVGSRIGSYEVRGFIGEGGMGRVFRAHDFKLKRDVALKVLPDRFANDTERIARFQREAQSLAALNHSNIAQIYGFEDSASGGCLILEFIDGETLEDRLRRGAFPLSEALPLAKQIAEALEAAHERGIVHRDLKPANIKINAEGRVKVLDFGLARIFEDPRTSSASISHSPTLMSQSAPGVILGTAAYMSPEQARGKAVDNRSDIWAFGCVLFEMLVGQRLFSGETVSDMIAQILERPVPLELLPANTPASIRGLIRRCLKKDVRDRLHEIADVRIEIEDALANAVLTADLPVTSSSAGQRRRPFIVAATVSLAIGIAIIAGLMIYRVPPVVGHAMRFAIDMPPGEVPYGLSLSPDGRVLAVAANGGKRTPWVRSLDSPAFQQVSGTTVLDDVFWSPSSADLFFTADDGLLRRINPFHGPAQTLFGSSAGVLFGGTINHDGTILLGSASSILRLNGPAGSPMPMTLEDGAARQASRIYPQFLPDGRHFIYLVTTPGSSGTVRVGAIDSKETQPLLTADSAAIYSKEGYLLFVKGTALMAERFDARTFALRGDAVSIASNAASGMLGANANGNAGFSVADDGTLAYIPTKAGNNGQLTWFDRSGNILGSIKQPADTEYLNPSISPDGKHLTVNAMDSQTGNWDIWSIDLDSQIPTRLTMDPAQDSDAIWGPDGNEIVFASTRGSGWGLYRKKLGVNGSEELLLKTDFECIPTDWTRDGHFIVYSNNTSGGVFALPLSGSDRKPISVSGSGFSGYGAKVSPDGNWIAYASNETGDNEIYVQGFPINANRQRLSSEGGSHPRWTQDGKGLFFWGIAEQLMFVNLRLDSSAVHAEIPKPVFPPHVRILDLLDQRNHYAVTPDGQRFLLRQPFGPPAPPINVIVNWTQALPK